MPHLEDLWRSSVLCQFAARHWQLDDMAASVSSKRLPRLCMILSPTKTLSFDCSGDNAALACTQPAFQARAMDLVRQMRRLTASKLKSLVRQCG